MFKINFKIIFNILFIFFCIVGNNVFAQETLNNNSSPTQIVEKENPIIDTKKEVFIDSRIKKRIKKFY